MDSAILTQELSVVDKEYISQVTMVISFIGFKVRDNNNWYSESKR